jgi:hypothetical protein
MEKFNRRPGAATFINYENNTNHTRLQKRRDSQLGCRPFHSAQGNILRFLRLLGVEGSYAQKDHGVAANPAWRRQTKYTT